MSRWKTISIILIVVVAAVALLVTFLERGSETAKIDITHSKSDSGEIGPVPQVITKTFPSESNDKYVIQVSYPELQGVPEAAAQDKVNRSISAGVYNQIASFQAGLDPNASLADPNTPKSSFNGSFTVALVGHSFFSALMSYTIYNSGAAHPENYLVALNYDLRSGAAVTLDKLLQDLGPTAGYMDRLGAYVKSDLTRQLGNDPFTLDAIQGGATPTADNYAAFNVGEDSLSIHFQLYQVAPYAAGLPVVDIPYTNLLDDIIQPANSDATATTTVEWWLG